jgi:HSP20 family protein
MQSGYDGRPDLFAQMRRAQSELGRLFGLGLAAGIEYPPVNVWAGGQGMILTALLPGVDPDQIEVTVHQDTLTLRGNRPIEQTGSEAVAHRRERVHGAFTRDLVLPLRVDADTVSARYEGGVLYLELPRPADDKPRQVKITHD